MEEQQETKSTNNPTRVASHVVVFLLGLALGAGILGYISTSRPEVLGLSKGQQQAQKEVDVLLEEVGKLINLPTDEKPTVATVTDIEKVKTQPFFKNAKNGDRVIIYTNAKKAILYRPSEKRIIEVGAVNINQQTTTETSEEQQEAASPTPQAEEE